MFAASFYLKCLLRNRLLRVSYDRHVVPMRHWSCRKFFYYGALMKLTVKTGVIPPLKDNRVMQSLANDRHQIPFVDHEQL